jgi:hypothetical protein
MGVYGSANDNKGKFPRTYHRPGAGLMNKNKGGLGNEPSNVSFSSTNPEGPVGASNVGASLYLLLKNGYLPPAVFMCPSNTLAEAIAPDFENYSNFGAPYRKYSSYSYLAQFPNKKGEDAGWRVNTTSSPEWPIASDINPGKGGANYSDDTGQDVTAVAYNDSRAGLRRANSNNHFNEGQAVAFIDGHVEWCPTVFVGPSRPGLPYRDNIFSNANGMDPATGKGGGPHQQPCDRFDAVMHPGDGAN